MQSCYFSTCREADPALVRHEPSPDQAGQQTLMRNGEQRATLFGKFHPQAIDFGGTMSVKRLLIAALVAVTMLAASAFAQKNELTGIIGRTFVSDQGVKGFSLANNNLHFGSGLTFEVNYGHFLLGNTFAHLTFEVPVVVNWDQDLQFDANVVPGNYRSYFVTPSLRANAFATTGVSPWVSFGGGIGRFSPSSQLESGGKNPTADRRPACSRWGSAWT
jgi:hypothetical protein